MKDSLLGDTGWNICVLFSLYDGQKMPRRNCRLHYWYCLFKPDRLQVGSLLGLSWSFISQTVCLWLIWGGGEGKGKAVRMKLISPSNETVPAGIVTVYLAGFRFLFTEEKRHGFPKRMIIALRRSEDCTTWIQNPNRIVKNKEETRIVL